MDDNIKAVILRIDEELDGLETLEFSSTDESYSFNVMDDGDTQVASRLTYDVTSRECTFETLNGADNVDEEIIATYTEGKSDYIVVTDDYSAIPILESFGINYIVSPNMDLQQKHIDAINKVPVCITTITGFATQHKAIRSTTVPLDFTKLSSKVAAATSLFDVAVAMQKNEKDDGLETINKYLYSTYKEHKDANPVNDNTAADETIETTDKTLSETELIADDSLATETETTTRRAVSMRVDHLIADPKYQQRVSEDQSAIDDLATAYRNDKAIPPIEVVDTGYKKIIVDGFHRYSGAKAAGVSIIECYVTVGTEREAFIMSLRANAKNKALKRTNADKRKAVLSALADDEFKKLSNRKISTMCDVSHSIVNKVKTEITTSGNVSTLDNRVDDNVADTPVETVVADSSAEAIKNINTGNVSTPPSTAKKHTQSISNKFVSLSITVKEPSNEIAFDNLMGDLKDVIDSYESKLEEVN